MPGKVIDLKGQTFGRLEVLDFIGVTNRNAVWMCRCQCGKVVPREGGQLRAGHQKSCGCWGAKRRPYESHYNNLVYAANRRGVGCSLTFEEFLKFTSETACHYCGAEIVWRPYSDQQTMRHNLDRIVNEKEYSLDNCVVCCYGCNCTRGDRFTYDEFLRLAPVLRSIRDARLALAAQAREEE
jgi:5-methylcytosine-specific restriction endonuclease McrA